MRKIIYIVFMVVVLFFVVGCGMEKNAKDVAIEYMELYRTKDERIIKELDEYVDNEDLSDNQKEKYRDVLEKEYSTLMYQVTNERYEGNTAFITMEITVIDLYKAQKKAANYFNENSDEFNDEDGEYDRSLYTDYKLDLMSKETDTITYTIDVKVEKENDVWKVVQLSNESLEKIHGIYNYEE